MNVNLILGPFQMGLNTLAPDTIQRSSGYTWAAIDVIGAAPVLQFTGLETDVITLPGVIYPHFKGGLAQLPAMRLVAEQGIPLPLITGYGFFLGDWVIEKIDETQSVLFGDGAPRKIEFNITLKQYRSALGAITSAVSAVSRLF